MRQTPGGSWRQIEVKVAMRLPAGSCTGPLDSPSCPESSTSTVSGAHETVAHAVKAALQQGVDLAELPLATLQRFDAAIEKDVFEVLTLRGSLNARDVLGGTAPRQVQAQIERHRARLGPAG